jgi:putative membrane protein
MDSTTRRFLIALGVLLAVALGWSALMGGMMGPGFMGSDQTGQVPFGPGMMHGYGWMGGLGMGLGMLVFWGLIIVLIYLLVQSPSGASSARQHPSTPLDVLKRRYAAGEISREQYEQMRKDLE